MIKQHRIFFYNDKKIVFATPSEMCEYRVRTLLTKEPLTIKWLNSFTEDDIFWDIGANVGMYSLYATVMRNCVTYGFEPQHTNYYILNENIRKNGLQSKIKAYCVALDHTVGVANLNQSGSQEPGGSAHIITPRPRPGHVQGVITTTIDHLVELGIPKPTRVKVDVDSIEERIFKGGKNTLPDVHSILTEINTNNNGHLSLVKTIESLGFYHNPDDTRMQLTGRHAGFGEILFYNERFVQR